LNFTNFNALNTQIFIKLTITVFKERPKELVNIFQKLNPSNITLLYLHFKNVGNTENEEDKKMEMILTLSIKVSPTFIKV